MAKEAQNKRLREKSITELRVLDDFAADQPVTPAELDAVEAFFGPLLHDLFGGRKLLKEPGTRGL